MMEETLTLFPEPEETGERLDKYLSAVLTDYSRSFLSGLIAEGRITVNGSTKKASYNLKEGDTVQAVIPEPEPLRIEAEHIPLDIIYEDGDILVVNKPQGMVVHPAPGHTSGTLVNALLYHCEGSLSGINGILRPGIVHRIDKDTSGLLVVCKNDLAHRRLAEQFAVHSITRIYTAICYGKIKESGTVNAPLGRDPRDRKKVTILPSGRHAVTHYEPALELKKDFTLIHCRLETGRTHQIRVHMASLKHPILGDPVYGPAHSPFTLNGQLLHAGTLGFQHPVSGEYLEFSSPLPEHFQRILNILS